MSCYYPVLARRVFKQDNGKWKIKFIPIRHDTNIANLRYHYGDDLMLLPCGHCLGCKFDRARDWATRCVCELQYHKQSCFITLTYDDKHYPGRLKKSDVKDFIKALRNRGVNCRFLACGELGSTTKRAHYHIILFGYCPDDLELHSRDQQGNVLYESKTLASIWSKGFILVGEVTYQSAGYVARYTTKKIGDDDCFLVCSNRPGIGYQYYVDHAADMVKTGFVYGQFGDKVKAPIPRYFEKFLIKDFPRQYDVLVRDRMAKVLRSQDNDLINHKFTNVEQLKNYNAEILDRKLARFDRR